MKDINLEIYRLAMQSVRDYAVFLIDPEGFVRTWNIGAELMKLWRPEEIIGKHYGVLFTPEDQEKGKPLFELEKARIEGLYEEEHDRMRRDGTFFRANVSLTALRNESGELVGFVKVTRDMTDRVEAERKLLESQEKLQRALSARDEFLSVASHELKTPLTSLKLQCDLFVHKFKKRHDLGIGDFERFARSTSTMVNKLNRLVDDMLDISRIQSSRLTLRKEDIELCQSLREVLDQLQPVFNISDSEMPEIESCQELPGHFDKLRIEQVFSNLLTNAIRYGEGKPIRVRAEMRNQLALVSIQDQGIGIPAEKIDRIFRRFERADRERAAQGLGLGLYIAREIVEAHMGKIWVESEVGKGSTFYVQLPLFNDLSDVSGERQKDYLKSVQ
jgi:PAS domain S-box-containing protein